MYYLDAHHNCVEDDDLVGGDSVPQHCRERCIGACMAGHKRMHFHGNNLEDYDMTEKNIHALIRQDVRIHSDADEYIQPEQECYSPLFLLGNQQQMVLDADAWVHQENAHSLDAVKMHMSLH
jgi:hypothetical protein